MSKRVFAVAAVLVVALVWASGPAYGQTYPPPVRSITVDDATPAPGQAITVTLRTCRPRTVALIGIGLSLVATPTVGNDGVARATVTVPSRLRPGRHIVSGVCLAPDLKPLFLTTTITIAASGAPGNPGAAAPPSGTGVAGAGGAGVTSGMGSSGVGGGSGAGGSGGGLNGLNGPAVPADAPLIFEEAAAASGVTDAGVGRASATASRSGADAPAGSDPGTLSTLARVALGIAALGGVPVALAVSRRPRRVVRQGFA